MDGEAKLVTVRLRKGNGCKLRYLCVIHGDVFRWHGGECGIEVLHCWDCERNLASVREILVRCMKLEIWLEVRCTG